VPEGDSLHAIARRLSVLAGERVCAESPNPRAAALGIATRLEGRVLERVEAVGKHLLLTFEGGLVLRSHLRMKGRWRVLAADAEVGGSPWLVLRGTRHAAVLWHGPVLELGRGPVGRLGPDVMSSPPDMAGMVARLRAADQSLAIGKALLDQRLVAGIGNLWRAEALHAAGISPWRRLGGLADEELERALQAAHDLMTSGRRGHAVYRRAGMPCRRCGAAIRSRPQGDQARMAYWCPGCQAGADGTTA
jgi:endonuclease-8